MSHFAIFNNRQLTDISGLTILRTDPYKPPKRKLNIAQLARTSKSAVNYAFYEKKNITIRVSIDRETRTDVENSIDSLLNILQGLEKELIIQQGSSRRKYICTLADAPVFNDGGSYIEIDLIFECSDRFGYALTSDNLLIVNNLTSGNKSYPVTFDGTATQVPVIRYTVDSFTNGSNRTVTFINPATSTSIAVNNALWVANDVLIIDCYNRTVTINGIDAEFEGNFPEWDSGAGHINYTDDFTERQVDILVTYVKRYL